MLTGDFGMPSGQMFFSQNVAKVGMEAPQAIFPNGETGKTNGEWKLVNKPINMGIFGNIDNYVMEWVDTKPAVGVAMAVGSGVEGVLVQESIKQVATGNIFTNQCPAGTTDFGVSCKYPDEWESCNADETDSGMLCQTPITINNGIFSGGNVRAKQFRVGKIVPK